MPVGLVCPSCLTPTTFHRAPITACPRCQQPFPEALRQSAEASLAAQAAPRPLLLTLGMYGAPGVGVLMSLALLGAATGTGTFYIGDEQVTGWAFLKAVGVPFTALALLCFVIAFGIWKERTWTRWAIMAFWACIMGSSLGFGLGDAASTASALGSGAFALLLSSWYLFGKGNVVEYYKGLEVRARAGHASVGDA